MTQEEKKIQAMVDSLSAEEQQQYQEMLAKIGPIRMPVTANRFSPAGSGGRITS